MAEDWLPPELRMTSNWTELLEYCDWDEEAAALLIEQVRYDMKPRPPAKIRNLIKGMIEIAQRPEPEMKHAEA